MSYKAMKWAWKQPIYMPIYKSILISLAWHVDRRGVAYPTVSELSDLSGASSRTIHRAINYLVKNGYIRKFKIKQNLGKVGEKVQNCYFLNVQSDDTLKEVI